MPKLIKKKTEAKPQKVAEAKAESKKPKTEGEPKKKGRKLNIKYLGGLLLKKMVRSGAKELGLNADEVNNLNVFPVPDGDTGDNMRMTIESGVSAIEKLDSDNLAEVMKALSRGMLLGARGNSGVILSQFFSGTAKGLEGSKKADPEVLGHALELGVKTAYSSVMTPMEGTILTVARESVEYAVKCLKPESTIRSFFADLVKEMHSSLERTPELLKALKDANVVDSGGAGLLFIMDGFNRVLNGEDTGDEPLVINNPGNSDERKTAFNKDSEMSYAYCTELLVQLMSSKCDVSTFDIDALRAFLCECGDSVVAFLEDSIVKLHVHTFTPERVLAKCREYGEFISVKIENMSLQHTEVIAGKEEKQEAAAPKEPKKKYGVVAVCTGEGIMSLYKDLGADVIIEGGQTRNPSTNDFLSAFEGLNAENIIVLPNNGNIFMAASQAADMYREASVRVIPCKNVGLGYVVLSTADFGCEDPEELVHGMMESMSGVTAGYVSPSVRDAEMNGVTVTKGDTVGIVDKEIIVSMPNRIDATVGLATSLLKMEGKSMLTVFRGADATEEEEQEILARLNEAFPEAEIYFMDGGQEIYPYIFVAE